MNNCTLPNLPISVPSHQVTTSPTCFSFSRFLQPQSREAFSEPSHRRTFTPCFRPILQSRRSEFPEKPDLHLTPILACGFRCFTLVPFICSTSRRGRIFRLSHDSLHFFSPLVQTPHISTGHLGGLAFWCFRLVPLLTMSQDLLDISIRPRSWH